MAVKLIETIERYDFRLVEIINNRILVFNFPPEKSCEEPNDQIKLILSLNGGQELETIRSSATANNIILFAGHKLSLVLPLELQSEQILQTNACVISKALLNALIKKNRWVRSRYLPQAETVWYICICGKKYPQGTLEAEPHPVFNEKINKIIIAFECDDCAKNYATAGLRFG